jgi:hypothetical protein
MADLSKVLAVIDKSVDPDALKRIIKNARTHNEPSIALAAFRKLVSLVPSERPGTVEHDFWQMVNAFEHVLTEEKGKTTRLNRTRQKVKRVGVVETLRDWALSEKDTTGFAMLLDREMPEYTGEAIVLRHSGRFEPRVVVAARKRLEQAGVDVSALPTSAN